MGLVSPDPELQRLTAEEPLLKYKFVPETQRSPKALAVGAVPAGIWTLAAAVVEAGGLIVPPAYRAPARPRPPLTTTDPLVVEVLTVVLEKVATPSTRADLAM
jgi:hypothetical protein